MRILLPVMRAAAEGSVLEDADAFDDAFYVLLNAAVWAGRAELWPPVHDLLDRASQAARMCFDAVADPARTAHDVRQRLDRATATLSPATPSWRVTWLIYSAMYVDCFAFYDGVWRDLVGHDAYDSLRFAQVARAHDAFMLGDWDKMLDVGSRNIADAADHEYNLLHMVFTYGLALVASGRGDEEALRKHCEAITAWAQPRRMNLLLSTVNETRARAAVGRGDFEEAFALTAALTPPGELTPHLPHFPRVFLDLVESAMRTDRVTEARAQVEGGRVSTRSHRTTRSSSPPVRRSPHPTRGRTNSTKPHSPSRTPPGGFTTTPAPGGCTANGCAAAANTQPPASS
ncbi:hypothetical protein ACFV29_32705 [Streptomyces sp. NPDC059690]|uniref:hypothetical protein n=1 Tax=Streptomyces sp. NPDC059690 TaxID=3346907 RepID=UPI00367D5FE8